MFETLGRTGPLDNTVLVFTSDEGYFFGEHGLSYERRPAYQKSNRIPRLVRYPRLIWRGATNDPFALHIDIAPTLLELTGLDRAPGLHGRSLVPLPRGEAPDWHGSFLIEYYSDTVFPRVRNIGYQAVRMDASTSITANSKAWTNCTICGRILMRRRTWPGSPG